MKKIVFSNSLTVLFPCKTALKTKIIWAIVSVATLQMVKSFGILAQSSLFAIQQKVLRCSGTCASMLIFLSHNDYIHIKDNSFLMWDELIQSI